MRTSHKIIGMLALAGVILIAAGTLSPALAQFEPVDWSDGTTSAAEDTFLVRPKNFGRAALEVFGVNLLVWTYDRYIREGGTNPVFRIGFNSWAENLEAGWNWDDNNFATNQFAHPYHGSLYFNAARSLGYSYWESIPVTLAGSIMWEYFGETHNPSLNDWVSTGIGGVALGEVLHRFGTSIRDNTASGSSRNWREVGGMLVDPMGGLNRIIDGDWARQGANPSYRYPKNYRTILDIGLRTRGEEKLWESDTTDVYVELDFEWGDPFFGDMGKPYDSFDFQFQLNFGDKMLISRVESSGNLAGMFLKETDEASHIIGAFHRFDFLDTNAQEFGAQSVTAGLLSRFETAHGLEMRTEVQAGPLLLGGATSDYVSVSGRSYDYGPGVSTRFAASFGRGGWEYLRVSHEQFWIHTISGNRSDHYISFTRLRFTAPVKYNIGVMGEYVLNLSERKYQDHDDVSVRDPQVKVALTWIMN